MTTPGMSSKWGSFFQQAVAGVEARLDNMLSEGEYAPDAVKAAPSTPADDDPKPMAGHLTQPVQPPTSRPNSRLQERLAKAVTSKSAPGAMGDGDGSPTRQMEGLDSAEESREHGQAHTGSPTSPKEGEVQDDIKIAQTATESHSPAPDEATSLAPYDEQAARSVPFDAQIQGGSTHTSETVHDNTDKDCPTCGLGRSHIQTLEARLTEVESLGREERHTHVERVDALESKLKFVTREMAESAQKLGASSTAGGLEKRLAEKDEKIALLVNEGQTLAATEHKHRSVIKKFRSDASERERSFTRLKGENEKLTVQLKSLQASAAAADSLRLETEALGARYNSLQADSSRLTLECNAKDDIIKALELELAKIDRAPSSEDRDAKSDTEEKNRIAELQELATVLQAEKERTAEKAQLQIDELRKKADTATEQSFQMKNELQSLEGKLEAMRVIAEEASSNAAGDAQAKLLRQIETLQSQYATACENWQGIEATLTSRITVLETERDEISERESSTRKKARDLTSQNRQQAEDLSQLRARIHDYQQEKEANQRDLAQLQKRVEIAEVSLTKASEQRQSSREPDDKAGRAMLSDAIPPHMEHSPRIPGPPLSPLHSPLRTWSSELLVPHSTSKSSYLGSFDGFRRASSPRDLGEQTEARAPDLPDPVSPPVSGKPDPIYDASVDPIAERLSSQIQVRDDVSEENADTLSTVPRAIPDIASVSTTAAGPSIQLVERMSAGIRRLEAEKVAGKEELLRISNQRDEARAEIVTLMKEIESGRQARDHVTTLEKEVAEINERYQTTLELLGEKSELVEELRADVQDVKAMYRELVERTIR